MLTFSCDCERIIAVLFKSDPEFIGNSLLNPKTRFRWTPAPSIAGLLFNTFQIFLISVIVTLLFSVSLQGRRSQYLYQLLRAAVLSLHKGRAVSSSACPPLIPPRNSLCRRGAADTRGRCCPRSDKMGLYLPSRLL